MRYIKCSYTCKHNTQDLAQRIYRTHIQFRTFKTHFKVSHSILSYRLTQCVAENMPVDILLQAESGSQHLFVFSEATVKMRRVQVTCVRCWCGCAVHCSACNMQCAIGAARLQNFKKRTRNVYGHSFFCLFYGTLLKYSNSCQLFTILVNERLIILNKDFMVFLV